MTKGKQMRSDRDNQRSKVYAAEQASGLMVNRQTIPNAELQGWVNAVLDRRVIRSRWGARSVEVKLTGGYGGASAWGSYKITASPSARNEYVMLHEIAHILSPDDERHGPRFCGVLLFLVRNVMGAEAHKSLLTAMREHRVKRSNAAIPAVRSNVPAPRKVRERETRKRQHEEARFVIARQVARGNITWKQVLELAKERQKAQSSLRAAKKKSA
jgi:putative metallohydrolase (TIGR04338 family)